MPEPGSDKSRQVRLRSSPGLNFRIVSFEREDWKVSAWWARKAFAVGYIGQFWRAENKLEIRVSGKSTSQDCLRPAFCNSAIPAPLPIGVFGLVPCPSQDSNLKTKDLLI